MHRSSTTREGSAPAQPAAEGLPPDLAQLSRFARAMDAAVAVPFTGARVGLDPILGLVPGLGDLVGAGMSSAIVVAALRHRVPWHVVLRMGGNLLVDAALGAVPVLGDLVDVAFKANLRNLDLLLAHRDAVSPPRTVPAVARAAVVGVAGLAAAASIAGSAALIALLAALV